MSELTVWCVCVGTKYNTAYVYALKEMVEKYLTVPHTFKCITTTKLPGIVTVLPFAPYQGWWSKLNLFTPRMATGPSIYLDLDVVITKNIDYLTDYVDSFSAPSNWAQSGHGGIQSSVMVWPGNWYEPFEKFDYVVDSERLWGDQEFLWELLGDNWNRIPHVGSYKYHVRPAGIIPEDLAILAFHGLPDPHEVTDQCLLPFTSTLRSLIKSSTDKSCSPGSNGTA